MMGMKDNQIREDVMRELRWNECIEVMVNNHVVTLSGTVSSATEFLVAQMAAQSTDGVLEVKNCLEVNPPDTARTDAEIAQAVRSALEWDTLIPDKCITTTISNGWVALEGSVDFLREREDAERLVRRLSGVRGVYNEITVNSAEVKAENVHQAIEGELNRLAQREAGQIRVALKDGTVTLTGHVHSWEEERAIINAACQVPGVQSIKDHLHIES